MNKLLIFFGKKDLYLGIARYTLATIMMGYGLLKIIGLQGNVVVPFSAWQQPLEHITSYQLTWAFLGHSLWFSVLLGIMEFVPACLLLFRRTTFIGSVCMLPASLAVFLINQALQLWPFTRLLSTGLLLLNIFVLAFEYNKLKQILALLWNKQQRLRYTRPELIINIVLILYIINRVVFHGFYSRFEQNDLMGDWLHRHQFEYNLVSEQVNDSLLPHRPFRSYFGPHGVYSEINDSVDNRNGAIRYTIDSSQHLLTIRFYKDGKSINNYYRLLGNFKYSLIGDSLLTLQQAAPVGNATHTWLFRKRKMGSVKPV